MSLENRLYLLDLTPYLDHFISSLKRMVTNIANFDSTGHIGFYEVCTAETRQVTSRVKLLQQLEKMATAI
jgi:hypothetical protein